METMKSVDGYKFEDNYYTYNRKLKIEEYDESGGVIDVIEFSQEDLFQFLLYKNNSNISFDTARKEDREYFKSNDLELVKKMLPHFDHHFFNKEMIKEIEYILKKYTKEQIEFALNFDIGPGNDQGYVFTMEVYNELKQMSFKDKLEWIKNSVGIYYAVSNSGQRGMFYLEKPTKKQAAYQRQKNDKRIVFFSFKDWKEYTVAEKEL